MQDMIRRDFLKMTGAAALGAALGAFGDTTWSGAAETSAPAVVPKKTADLLQPGKLGFGMMRLPLREAANPERTVPANREFGFDTSGKYEIDMEATRAMVDAFLEAGFTYFDTSYVYLGGRSEIAVREALVKRHPRESFILATKLPTFSITEKAQIAKIFEEQLEKCGVDFFDYYLLHNIQNFRYDPLIAPLGEFEYVKAQKEAGRIRRLGFSFHDSPELLDRILTEHPETDFVQLVINYYDWDSPFVRSRRCYEVARKHGKDVVVMQPVKAGTLARVPEEAEKLLRTAAPDLSPACWAIRFAAGLEGVVTVLSGMSSLEQVQENAAFMRRMQPLSEAERDMLLTKIVPLIKKQGPLGISDFSKYEGIAKNGMPVAGVLDAYNSCLIQPDPTFSAENNYYKPLRYDAKIPEGQSWISGKLIAKDGEDVTELVAKAEKWLLDNMF